MAGTEVRKNSLTQETVESWNQSGYKVFGLSIPAWRSPLTQGIRNMEMSTTA